jgi:hypothetical protein
MTPIKITPEASRALMNHVRKSPKSEKILGKLGAVKRLRKAEIDNCFQKHQQGNH